MLVSSYVDLGQTRTNSDASVYNFLDKLELFGNDTIYKSLRLATLLARCIQDKLIVGFILGRHAKDVLQGLFSRVSHTLDKVFPDSLRGFVDKENVQVSQKLDLVPNLINFCNGRLHPYRCQSIMHGN